METSDSATDRRLRILIATRCVVPIKPGHGGAETAGYELARALAGRGHDVTLLADSESVLRDDDGLNVVEVDSRLLRWIRRRHPGFAVWIVQHFVGNMFAARAVRRVERDQPHDVIHAHGSLSSILIGRFAGPVIYTEHDAPPWHCRYRRWWERAIRNVVYRVFNVPAQRRADGVIALFDEHGEEMRERWKARAVSVIANAADAEAFYPDASRRRTPRTPEVNGNGSSDRRRYGFDRYCLFAGELSSRKAPDVLLRALVDAPGVCCVVAGDGPMRGQLEQLAENLEISDRVAFLGRQSSENLARIYADADLLVLPSVSEAAPLVVAEAMASGTPVVATRIAGIPALVRNGDTGFLVEPEDVDGLAAALRTAMSSDDLLAEMSKRAFIFVREALAWSAVAGEHEGAYMSLLSSEPPSGPRWRNGTRAPARKRERRIPGLVRS